MLDYDLCENNILKKDLNVNLKMKMSEYAELFCELYCTSPESTDTLPATTIYFNTARIVSREKHDLKYIFGVECNGTEFISMLIVKINYLKKIIIGYIIQQHVHL